MNPLKKVVMTATATSLFVSGVAAPVFAGPNMDYFSHTTPGNKKPEQSPPGTPTNQSIGSSKLNANALDMMSARTPAVTWFEAVDTSVAVMRPSAFDAFTLTQSFNQEAERVQKWINTATKVAKNYRRLASSLKNMTVPPDFPGLKEYRDSTADWYVDKAEIYEELMRPRRPAKTMEELEQQLNEVKDRATNTAETAKRLKEMDISLRKAYHVHASREDDALSQYVMGKQSKISE